MSGNTNTSVVKRIDVLKSMLAAPSVQEQFKNALDKYSGPFIASIIDLYNGNSDLQLCEPKAVIMEALKAAVLKLPINKSLGFAYIIPYNNSVKDPATGNWTKVMVPTFELGYKGYIQLAMRTGQYRTINADVVYEGELRKVNKLTGEIAFDGEKTSDKIVGYFCYFELLNGFSKTLYMTVDQMATHAKRYAKGIKKETTIESLLALANLPVQADSKVVGWMGNFHGMALKTVIRLLLSKYGYLSIEMQEAFDKDSDEDNQRDELIHENGNSQPLNVNDVSFEDVTHSATNTTGSTPESKETDPGY
jgi:recombination protein RecT